MKIVRILVYEADERELELHLAQTFVGPDRSFARPPKARAGLTIREIFRGSELERDSLKVPDSIPDIARLDDEETAP